MSVFKRGDVVKLKDGINPNARVPLGVIDDIINDFIVVVNITNSTCFETNYTANLEHYKRPLAVGDEVYLDDDENDKGRIIALHGGFAWVDNYSDNGKNWGLLTREIDGISLA